MESFLSRYRNLIVLLAVVLGQMIGLAVQVRKSAPVTGPIGPTGQPDGRGVRLIRVWAETAVMPFERGFLWTGSSLGGLWANYVDLRNVRQQNKDLQQTVDRLRFEQAQVYEDALEGQRLKELLKFQQSYVYATTPAQVIGASGSLQSRVMWIDKGIADGVKVDMAVVTPDGIVGKVREAFTHTSQVLAINDQSSGAGVILETTRIRGILRGNAQGQPQVINILMDSRIKPGEKVLTAGGDQIFPRGLPVGVVEKVEQDPERSGFINVIVKPATNLQHVDEVLVITSLEPHLSAAQMADLKTS
ncbi:MAG TPA: rod shape-determining protein MreC, partial [Acidobacteriaceae bacterium]|nr:rod shape-determining protein MreC [Acidobacteriaceae bacterium]